ncbi:Zinc metalloproteinase nas-2 [Caenorhabditis elegans]|uniref:Metalloendopeptidase n=1 Tax=Caenorhabditis elegans TaxID=6239 RepID=Q966D9_CAEEL|nr:Metalloendopeptidase [Caenorhabditis elegans]NP_503678.3 Zinc metalloproteinase nas-2 [Caenorhabditis elegans]CCD62311.2 Zinc metalloproteinase nas-2 [Caenorhabditis elegans]CCD64363.2 Metalloendopeptidase [Caenorhabditis elegans]|eukprot:NP_503652.3 Metalloendopeptidase [Caenorhabditis elegans]
MIFKNRRPTEPVLKRRGISENNILTKLPTFEPSKYGHINIPLRKKRGIALHPLQWASYLWPNAEVPYDIATHYTSTEKSIILSAMEAFKNVTCVRFRPRAATDKHYLQINKYFNVERCFSYIGRQSSRTLFGTPEGNVETRMRLDPACLRGNGRGIVMHELMHILGFYHEHQRDDRDRRIVGSAVHYNFKIYRRAKTLYMGAYDANSIMHYNFQNLPWQRRDHFSTSDIININTFYKCKNLLSSKLAPKVPISPTSTSTTAITTTNTTTTKL